MKKTILPMLIVASIVNLSGMIGQSTAQAAVVPDVVGLEEADAVDAVISAGLTVICAYENSESVREGYVISQNRRAGTTVPSFSLVILTVSLGPEMVVVPDVVGDFEIDAVSEIESAGLIISHNTYQYSKIIASKHVISQDPAGGTSVPIGSTVSLTISLGPEMVAVPDVEGDSETDADSTLTSAGLTVSHEYQNSETVAEGYVISQYPAKGTMVRVGSRVYLTISLGPEAAEAVALTVSSTTGGSVAQPGEGTFFVTPSESILIRATPVDANFLFVNWSGTAVEAGIVVDPNSATTTLVMDSNPYYYTLTANFCTILTTLYVGAADPNDPIEHGTPDQPITSIQDAIDMALDESEIVVSAGVYEGGLVLGDKDLSLVSQSAIIVGDATEPAISFTGTDANCILSSFSITGGRTGIVCNGTSPVIANCIVSGNQGYGILCIDSNAIIVNCTITGNYGDPGPGGDYYPDIDMVLANYGGGLYSHNSNVELTNSIVWNNQPESITVGAGAEPIARYCDIEGGWSGPGNLNTDPYFIDPGYWDDQGTPADVSDDQWIEGDYHLMSTAGRWDPGSQAWESDQLMSPCIDAGDPSWPLGDEPIPHGDCINMGAYGGTNQASKQNVPPDRFEANDNFAEVADLGTLGYLTEADLTIHESGNDDFYRLTAADSGMLNVDILFSHSLGDLSLRVYDSSYTLLASSATTTDNESVSVAVTTGQNYYVRVSGWAGATNPDYDLVIDGPGVPDHFEPNDNFAAATDLGMLVDLTEADLTIHESGNDDFYRLTPEYSGMLNVDILFSHSLGDLNLMVFSSSYMLLVSSATTTDNESVSVVVTAGQNYYVVVLGDAGATHPDYDLVIDGPEAPVEDCFEPNDDFAQAEYLGILGDLTEADLTIHESGNHDYYRLIAAYSGILNVDILFSHSLGDLNLRVYRYNIGPSYTLLASSTTTTDNESVSVAVTTGQNYYVRVSGWAGATNPDYDLVIDGPEVPADRFEANDSFLEATDLGTLGILTEANLTIHESANDDYYRLTAANSGTLNVDILFRNYMGDLNLAVYDSSYTLLASSATTTDNESVSVAVTSGQNYYVVVLGDAGVTYDLVIDIPDRFEPNDNFAEAAYLGTLGELIETELTIHELGNDDYYLLTAADSGILNVAIFFSHSLGDLNLKVYDSSQSLLASSATTRDHETVSVPVTTGQNYYVRVYGITWTHPDYDLVIGGPDFPVDRFESNDNFAEAADLGIMGNLTEADLTIHESDNDDYYLLTAADSGTLNVDILFSHSSGDLSLRVYDSSHTLLANSATTTDNESVSVEVTGGQTYYVLVLGDAGAINPDYDLVIDGPEYPADRFEPNDAWGSQATDLGMLGDLTEADLTIHESGDYDFYLLTAAASGTLNVDILFSHSSGDLSLRVYYINYMLLASSSTTTDNESVSVAVGTAYNYYVVVSGEAGATNSYDLVIDGPESPADRFEPNDDFAEAADLGIMGDLTEPVLTIHESGNDDYYLLTAADSGTLNVDILFKHSLGDLNLAVYDSSQSLLASSDTTTDNESVSVAVTGGQTYYVLVLGYAGAVHPTYALVIDGPEAHPPDRFEPNDNFAEATDLGTLGNWSEFNLTIHESGNDDYYLLTAAYSGTLNMDLLFTHSFGDLNLAVYDSSQSLLASSDTTTDNESVSVAVTAGQTYYVQVYGYLGATNPDYDLVIYE